MSNFQIKHVGETEIKDIFQYISNIDIENESKYIYDNNFKLIIAAERFLKEQLFNYDITIIAQYDGENIIDLINFRRPNGLEDSTCIEISFINSKCSKDFLCEGVRYISKIDRNDFTKISIWLDKCENNIEFIELLEDCLFIKEIETMIGENKICRYSYFI